MQGSYLFAFDALKILQGVGHGPLAKDANQLFFNDEH